MDPKDLPIGIDPERAFSISVIVGPYHTRHLDGSTTRFERQSFEWIVDSRGYTPEKFSHQLGERIIWGSCQDVQLWCIHRDSGEELLIQNAIQLCDVFLTRWRAKFVPFYVKIVDKKGSESRPVLNESQHDSTHSVMTMSQPKSPNAAATSNAVPPAIEAYTPDVPTNALEGTSNAVPPATEAYTPYVTTNASEGRVDWSTLHINESAVEDDRDVAMGDDAMYELLGLTDEDGIANRKMHTASDNAANSGVQPPINELQEDPVAAEIPVDDINPEEMHCMYDRDRPRMAVMAVGCTFPTMKDFRMAIRQYAINEESDLVTSKSDPTRFRGKESPPRKNLELQKRKGRKQWLPPLPN